ncbi:hypothetical protein ACGAJ9_06915 [Clostridioides difficile]|uniref:hypothetical protein n=1 Tax=Clostridioides difficile TaxID=1496 RepID=UPI00370CE293
MDRYTFDNLPIKEQIQYINNKLLEGNTLTNTCKDIGIGRTTIRNRFKQHGYEFNQAKKLYISIVEVIELESNSKLVYSLL